MEKKDGRGIKKKRNEILLAVRKQSGTVPLWYHIEKLSRGNQN